ncbi:MULTISPECIES: hypothetical protein [unclassified Novosphingobium]|uniref:hypothetical protein n=1 Tax=unclassified Novosphingobium TaxID=2644732 RepID=UPI001441F6B1|nr:MULTISPECIES: hypothetical protein [unclassified Novosphingobium]MBB3358969.1 hypothetical protein [Novosphingobium sp. BK256]MBB3375550.1 hypothetical protein [Novosphingobium sp. BK280]MBB3379741.1 hypothetical protein [Novosphingobium sp. BK258]MBB3421436.1 hypothetical protein [Novosphingobium sp. BK267]MBB3449751.1 hypothetical protein [Novosphingobium sp. BK352]
MAHSGQHRDAATAGQSQDNGIPAGPATPVNAAQTTDLAGNPLDTANASGPCTTAQARASLAQCRTATGSGIPAAPLALVALACALLAAGVWTLTGQEIRKWIDGQGWDWQAASQRTGSHGRAARALRRRRRLALAMIVVALALGIVGLVAAPQG